MKARIRAQNLSPKVKTEVDKALREYIQEKSAEYERELKLRIIQNTLAATCLALNDQYGFGAKRIQRLLDGAVEILLGNNEEVYAGHKKDEPGENSVLAAMLAELEDRNIKLIIHMGEDSDGIEVQQKKKIP